MLMGTIKNALRNVRDLWQFCGGWLNHINGKPTPPDSYQALIRLFCGTGGRFNDVLSKGIGALTGRAALPDRNGILGNLTAADVQAHVATLRERGYLLFPEKLPADMLERLRAFALDTPAKLRRMDKQSEAAVVETLKFDPADPKAIRYDYSTQVLLDNADVQRLLADHSILSVAQEYLGATPRADILSMWWHTNFHSQPDSEAAQFYHFDMDRIKWLKIFIYLTDVGPNDGAHSFVEGSHRTGGIPYDLLQKGYVRLSDEEVRSHYGDAKQIAFVAPKGTIIIEDTRGLHKGNAVQPNGSSRLMLQLQFSNSLFGGSAPLAKITAVQDKQLGELLVSCPKIYEQFAG
jgi:hypothetical protein